MPSCGNLPLFVMGILTCCVSAPLVAENAQNPVSSIRVTADAHVTSKPDRVQIEIGVVTRAKTSQDAAAQNAVRVDAVLAAVKKAAANAQLKTTGYSLSPNYDSHSVSSSGSEAKIVGYSCDNIVRVTLDELDRMGAVIDAATQAGANNVQGIEFTLRDTDSARAAALREAAIAARARAEVLAAALGVKVVRVLNAEDHSDSTPRMFKMSMARTLPAGASVPTQIESGTLDVSANVTLTVEVSPVAR